MNTSLADAAPMSPQLSVRCVLAVLVAGLVASAIGLLALGPVALETSGVSARTGSGWLEALSPWPMLAAAGLGLWWAGRVRRRPWRQAWRCFFRAAAVAAALATFASLGVDAWSGRLARIAGGSACATLALIFLAERLGARWIATRALTFSLLAGPLAALAGMAAQALHGQVDHRLLLWLELLPLLLLPLGVWGLPSRGLTGFDWLVALLGYGAAKWAQGSDAAVLAASQGAFDGATLSRWLVGAMLLWLGATLLKRQPGLATLGAARADASAAAPSSSQRDTSATTCG